MENKQKKILAGVVVAIAVVGAGTTIGVSVHHEQVVQAALVKKEKNALTKAKEAMTQAYKTRSLQDITAANTAISRLSKKDQKSEIKSLMNQMTALKGYLAQIATVNTALTKVAKTKTEGDINATQALINKMTDQYLANDKKSAQAKLDALKKNIAAEKAAAAAQAAAQTSANQQVASNDTGSASTGNDSTTTGGYSGSTASADTGQAADPASSPTTGGTPVPTSPYKSGTEIGDQGNKDSQNTGGAVNQTPGSKW